MFGSRGAPGDRPGLWGGLSCSRGSLRSFQGKRDVHADPTGILSADRVSRHLFGEPQHRRAVVRTDDLVGLEVTELAPVVCRIWTGRDVGQARPLVLTTCLASATAGPPPSQALGCLHVEQTGVDGLVDALRTPHTRSATLSATRSAQFASGDRPRRELRSVRKRIGRTARLGRSVKYRVEGFMGFHRIVRVDPYGDHHELRCHDPSIHQWP